MKILFILENHYPNIGGVETLFKSLTEALVKKGHQITILTNQFDSGLERDENLNGVQIIRVPFRNRYLFTLLAIFPAYKLARKHEVIHTTSYNAGVPAFFAGLLSRKKVLITFHEVWGKLWFELPFMNKFSLGLHYLFERFLLLLPFHKFIAVSKATKNSLIKNGIKEGKIKLIHNGIDYRPYEGNQNIDSKALSEKMKFIYFGRLGISKGLDILIDAVEILKARGENFLLKMIIPTEPASFHTTILDMINDRKLSSYIEIKSDLSEDDLISEIKGADSVLIPSYSEGFCFTAVESMALGIPIISSGKGALEEVVTGKHLTMKTHDGEGLADQMHKAIRGAWDETTLVKFPLEKSVDSYLQMYKKIDSYL